VYVCALNSSTFVTCMSPGRGIATAFKHLILSRCMADNYLAKDGGRGARYSSGGFLTCAASTALRSRSVGGWCPRAIIKSGVKVAPRAHIHSLAESTESDINLAARARAAAAD
jgi:hypothetical protein